MCFCGWFFLCIIVLLPGGSVWGLCGCLCRLEVWCGQLGWFRTHLLCGAVQVFVGFLWVAMWSVLEFLWVAPVGSAPLSFGCDIRDEELLEAGGMCFLLRDHSRAALIFLGGWFLFHCMEAILYFTPSHSDFALDGMPDGFEENCFFLEQVLYLSKWQ